MESAKPLDKQPDDNSSQAVLLYKEAVQYCIDNYGVKSKQVIDTNISIYDQDEFTKLYQAIVVDNIQNAPEKLKEYLIHNNCINDNVNKEFMRCAKACYKHFEKFIQSLDLFTSNIVGDDEREYFIDLYQSLELSFDERTEGTSNLSADNVIKFLRDKQIYVDLVLDYDQVDDREVRERFCFNKLLDMYPENLSYGDLASLPDVEREHLCDLFDVYLRTKNSARLEDYLLELGMLEIDNEDLVNGEYIEKVCKWFNDIWVDYNPNEDYLDNYDKFRVAFYDSINSTRSLRGKTFKQSLEEAILAYKGTANTEVFREKLLKTLTARALYNFDLLSQDEYSRIQDQFTYSQ